MTPLQSYVLTTVYNKALPTVSVSNHAGPHFETIRFPLVIIISKIETMISYPIYLPEYMARRIKDVDGPKLGGSVNESILFSPRMWHHAGRPAIGTCTRTIETNIKHNRRRTIARLP